MITDGNLSDVSQAEKQTSSCVKVSFMFHLVTFSNFSLSEISSNISLEVKATDIQLSLTDTSDNARHVKVHNTAKYVARV